MSPDLNHIEHIWDMLGRRIQAREPPVQNIRQLETQYFIELFTYKKTAKAFSISN
jgi:hypothetical protein